MVLIGRLFNNLETSLAFIPRLSFITLSNDFNPSFNPSFFSQYGQILKLLY